MCVYIYISVYIYIYIIDRYHRNNCLLMCVKLGLINTTLTNNQQQTTAHEPAFTKPRLQIDRHPDVTSLPTSCL